MSEIERYTSEYGSGYDGEGGYGFMQEDAEGAWVSFEDHQRIVAELERSLSNLPADWSKDSSLKTWFPFTAEEVEKSKSRIAELERKLAERDRKIIDLFNKIARAIGWVEEVKCFGEQAQLEQRSFITELEIAALSSAQGKSDVKG